MVAKRLLQEARQGRGSRFGARAAACAGDLPLPYSLWPAREHHPRRAHAAAAAADQPTAVVKLIHPARVRRCVAAVEWVTQTCVAFDGLCGVACGALLSPLRQMAFEAPEATGNLSELLAELRMIDLDDRGPDINGIARPVGTEANQRNPPYHGSWGRYDTLEPRASSTPPPCGRAITRSRRPSPRRAQALYLRLLTNAGFKAAFASAYARHYTEIAMCYAHSTAAESDGPRESLVFASQISVNSSTGRRSSGR